MNRFRALVLSGLAIGMAMLVGCGGSGGGADAPAKASVDRGPVGLFFMTRYWSYTRTLEKAAWYFAPDGTVYQNLETGFSAADLAAHTGRRGTYRMVGSDVEVTWSDGKISKSHYEPDKSGFSWDAGIFSPVQPIGDKKLLAGTYDGGESLSRRGDWASVAKKLVLGADGSHTLEGVAFVKSETDYAVLAAGSDKSTKGTWDASGYSITFKDDSGKTVRQIAFPFDDDTTPLYPDHLFIGGTLYKRLP